MQIDVDAMELEKENIEDFWSRDSKEKKNISSLMKGEDKRDQAMLIDRLMKQFEEQEIKFKRLEEENQILKSSIEKITYTYSQNEKVGITNAAHAVVHNESVGVYNEAVGVHNKFVGVHNESVGLHTAPSKTLFAA